MYPYVEHLTGTAGGAYYISEKIPFAINYVDSDYVVNHDSDKMGDHGSHVAGIAAANRFIPAADGGYADALTEVYVQGVAPDAQIIVMKVFGSSGGAYESDYMVAIEDAVMLNCDAVNVPESFRLTARRFMYYQFFHTALSFEPFIEPP